MKRHIMLAAAAFFCAPALFATYMEAPLSADPTPVNPDSTGFKFTDVKILPTTSVKDQNKSGTCWAFSGISTLEEDVLRRGGDKDIDLSEMFVVRNAYIDKAKKYMRMNGKINFAQGGSFEDVINMTELYGAMPEEAYPGIQYGAEKHEHYELADALTAYLDAVMKRGSRGHLSDAWFKGYTAILDAYLGEVPEKFTYKGKTYTPQEYAKAVGLQPEKFASYTSFTHHPFYEEFMLEIPDNWAWAASKNVPLADLQAIVDNALENGYTVSWGADVSEGGFKWKEGYAVIPEKKSEKDMTDTELSKWVKLSDKDREDARFKVKGPVKEIDVTQESRQKGFDNFETTDDHGMCIIGYAVDQEGNKYYKVKNSWDTNQVYDGYIYVSVPFFLAKTISIGVNEEAVPKDIAKKFKK